MHDPLPQVHFEFPFGHSLLRGRAVVAVAIWRGDASAERMAPLLADSEERERLRRRVSHPRRLAESFLARVARDELKLRGLAPESRGHHSLSHTSTSSEVVAAAVIAGDAVGVDVESVHALEDRRGVIERILSAEERRIMEGLPVQERDAAVLRRWCAKEALAKALGTGLTAPLEQYGTIILSHDGSEEVLGFERFPEWIAVCSAVSALVLSVCMRRDSSA